MERKWYLKRGVGACAGVGVVGLTVAIAPSWGSETSEPESFSLTGIVRDFRPSPNLHPDFDDPNLNGPYAVYVQLNLDEQNKPVYSAGTGKRVHQEWRDANSDKICWCLPPQPGDSPGSFGGNSDGAVYSAESFAQWFRDVAGVNLSTSWKMTLTKETNGSMAGAYEFETNDFHPFHPIDGQLYGNGNDQHNWYFTYEMVGWFTYDASASQFIRFKGDDDAWIFIDGKLVMDHGGIAGSREYIVKLDRLGLEDGESYDFRFFHAERHQPQSQFHLWTNIVMSQADPNSVPVSAAYD